MKTFEQFLNTEYTIYLDLDGVLVNFDKLSSKIAGDYQSNNQFWTRINNYCKNHPFFSVMEWQPGGQELYSFIKQNFKNVYILSSTGLVPNAKEEKTKWVQIHIPEMLSKVIFVQHSREKCKYAALTHILVDDQEKSTLPWINEGGIAILHKNTPITIKSLKGYIDAKQISS